MDQTTVRLKHANQLGGSCRSSFEPIAVAKNANRLVIGRNISDFLSLIMVFIFGFQRPGHAHFFTIPNMAAPTNTFWVDDAGAGSTASWVFTHGRSFFNSGISNWLCGDQRFSCHEISSQDFSEHDVWLSDLWPVFSIRWMTVAWVQIASVGSPLIRWVRFALGCFQTRCDPPKPFGSHAKYRHQSVFGYWSTY